MADNTGLGGLLYLHSYQRLPINDVHRHWNDELHRNKGHIYYKGTDSAASKHKALAVPEGKPKTPNSWKQCFETLADAVKIGKWVNQEGDITLDEAMRYRLVELVKRGDLHTYVSPDPSVEACDPVKLAKVNWEKESDKYYIDRDELGCLLVGEDKSLPGFWYKKGDIEAYRDQLSRGDAEALKVKEHRDTLLKENEALKNRLKDSMPYLDPKHPFYSAELEAAVTCWLEHYWDKEEGENVAKKPKLSRWIKEHRPDAIRQPNGKESESALGRIVMVVNPNKIGGREPKNT